MGTTEGGSVCITPVLLAERFFSWKPDPLAEATNAFKQDWGPLRTYANPLVSNGESSQASEGSGGSSGPSVEGSAMVFSSSEDALGLSLVDYSLSRSFSHDLQLSGNGFSAPAIRMAYLRSSKPFRHS